MYSRGQGVAHNDAEALKWFRRSAEQGLPEGQYAVGIYYEQGWEVSKDLKEAKKWLEKAAKQGHVKALKALKRLGEK